MGGDDGGLLGLKLRRADDFLREVGLEHFEHALEGRDGEGIVSIFFAVDCQPGPEAMLLTGAKLAESVGWPSHFDALREKIRAVHATIAALLAGARNRLMCHNAGAGVRGIVAETFPHCLEAIYGPKLTPGRMPDKPRKSKSIRSGTGPPYRTIFRSQAPVESCTVIALTPSG